MPTVACDRCGFSVTVQRTGMNKHKINYDTGVMVDRCEVYRRQLAETGRVAFGSEGPQCPHIDQSITNALNRNRW
jgi:hypothetical protein